MASLSRNYPIIYYQTQPSEKTYRVLINQEFELQLVQINKNNLELDQEESRKMLVIKSNLIEYVANVKGGHIKLTTQRWRQEALIRPRNQDNRIR
ncbi:unnamed protein product [Paramecium octaurelia]|uniref:Uncharacterized protein n=1 Tax=Paramecium octaurelia TaxID=43137 RepID=A0A8S1X5T6_PAROT|nr:unnamed protein product [Paramecium octaurelia]